MDQTILDSALKGMINQCEADIMDNVQVGSIFYNSWGWEQTNISWYQVVKRTPKTVTLRAIHGLKEDNGDMTGRTMPQPGYFKTTDTFQKKLYMLKGYDGVYVSMMHGSTELWDGKAKRYSTYA